LITVTGHAGRSVLHHAVKSGHAPVVELLCKNASLFDVNAVDRSMHTPLHVAAQNGHLACLEILLATPEVDPLASNCRETPLHAACLGGAKSGPVATVRWLIDLWQSSDEMRGKLRPWLLTRDNPKAQLSAHGFQVRRSSYASAQVVSTMCGL
jgi:ankyrin repeat protein